MFTFDEILGDFCTKRTRQMELFQVFQVQVFFTLAVAQVEVIDDVNGVDEVGQVSGGNAEDEALQILTIDLDLPKPGQPAR